jgi:hypothetical protein
MPLITIFTQQSNFINALVVSDELYNQLNSATISKSIRSQTTSNQDVLTIACLAEFRAKFLEATIFEFNLRNPTQSTIWNLNKANLYANQLYPWYRELLSFLDYTTFLPYPDTNLLIEVTL